MKRYLTICAICLCLGAFLGTYLAQGSDTKTFIDRNTSLLDKTSGGSNITLESVGGPLSVPSDLSVGSLSISGTVFSDLNGTGLRTKNYPGLQGWTIILSRNGNEILQTSTNYEGRYSFKNLTPGTYIVAENMITGWNQTYPGGVSQEGNYTVNLIDRDADNYDFGNDFVLMIGQGKSVPKRYPVMPLEAWIELGKAFEKAPEAPILSEVGPKISATTSLSLLSQVPYDPVQRDQGYCGNCWVWGCTGVVEIAHKIQNGVSDRLSIQYLNSNFNGGTGSHWAGCGGNPYMYSNFYSSTGKFIPWSDTNAQYQDGSNWACPGTSRVSASSISTNPNYSISSIQDLSISTHAVGQSTAIANIKNILNQNKGIAFSFFLPNQAAWNDFFAYWDSGSSTPYDTSKFNGQSIGNGFGGHLVLCVGYDDTSNSWIMLNSWGNAGGLRPNGTFKVKMSMNYDAAYPGGYAMYWETLGVTFAVPTVTNSNGASAVTTSSARLNGEVTSTGGQNPTVHIYWGTTDGGTNQAIWQHDENLGTKPVGTFYKDISNLAQGTTYYYRCFASNSAGSSWASRATFSTVFVSASVGVFYPNDGHFYLDYNGNGKWDTGDVSFPFGLNGDLPVAGDWNDDDKDEVGVFHPNDGHFYLDYNGNRAWDTGDVSFPFGLNGDLPVAGDWNGDGKDEVGVFYPNDGHFYLDYNGNRAWDTGDVSFLFGLNGDLPVAGDWNDDDKDEVGVFYPNDGHFYLDYNGNRAWDTGDVSFPFGLNGDLPVAGDWNDDGKDKVGVFYPNDGHFYLDQNGNHMWDSGDVYFPFGVNSDLPVAGIWS